ncbi:uncharacterized protein LOC125519591 [Triticum urartu]|uniref:uncharacterized protein LOC125519591 n=1 Tax=Triticum urartu TaxID=4572 RepID=UPI002043722A|nr:uncharacterized protein LOC125519591 [Triticum urartu]
MECFGQDYCLLLFIPPFEGQKQTWATTEAAVEGCDGAPEEAVEAPLHAAARARGSLLLRRASGGGGALHADSKADDTRGAGWSGDEGERFLCVHRRAHRHRGVARRVEARASGQGIRRRRCRRDPCGRRRRWWRRRPSGQGRRGSDPVHHGGARAGHQPRVVPHGRLATGAGSTAVGASRSTGTMSRGVVSTATGASSGAVAARGDMSSGAAAEPSDGLHPATETAEATNSMAMKGNEAVAATILADQTEEEGDEACHLTDGECSLSSPSSVVSSRSCWLSTCMITCFESE